MALAAASTMSLNFSKLVEYAKVFVSSKEMFILPT
jgi:hypothetical protein